MTIDLFKKLGEDLEKQWLAAGYDEKIFPDLAANILAEANIPSTLSALDLYEWGLNVAEFPQQRDIHSNFGDPPITLYNGSRFVIDVYFWLEGTTAIHQHAFCGAFQVFHGSSIHSRFDFKTESEINFFAKTGKLELSSCELLNVGDIQKINPGEQYIHSLFHLDQPSATIVARTSMTPLNLPQFSYFKSGFAVDHFFETPVSFKKTQLLSSAIRANHPDIDRLLDEYLDNIDFHSSFLVLQNLQALLRQQTFKEVFGLEKSGDRLDRCIEIVMEAHPEHGDLPKRLFAEILRRDNINALRAITKEPELRFFLALLLNVDSIEDVYSLIRERFPDEDPVDKFLDWVSDLGNTKVVNGYYPNGLGIDDFSDFDTAVLEELLDGKSEEEIVESLMSGSGQNEEAKERVTKTIAKLRGSFVFEAILK